jgi:hypothetical protein
MEKESQPDSMTTVTIKPDYPPSEVYSSEPPPVSLVFHKIIYMVNVNNILIQKIY